MPRHEPPSILAVYEDLGGEVTGRRSGDYLKVRCILHQPDRTPSATINEDTGRYFCFVCGEALDGFGLLMRFHGVDFRKALKLARKYDSQPSSEGGTRSSDGLLRRPDHTRGGSVSGRPRNHKSSSAWSPPWLRVGGDDGA